MSKWPRDVVVFLAIAFGLTYLANRLPDLASGAFDLNLVLCGFGPLVSGLVCYRLLGTKNTLGISLLGTRPVFSVAVCLVPIAVVFLTQTQTGPTVILAFALMQLLYCFGEECGWRHYLQNATSGLRNEWLQSLLIGSVWFLWHFSFLDDPASQMLGSDLPVLVFAPVMIVLLTGLSYLFGMMVKRTRSILFPTAGHLLFKTGFVSLIVGGLVIAVTLILWKRLPFGERASGERLG